MSTKTVFLLIGLLALCVNALANDDTSLPQKCYTYFQQGDYEKVIKICCNPVKYSHPLMYNLCGTSHRVLKNYKEAKEYLLKSFSKLLTDNDINSYFSDMEMGYYLRGHSQIQMAYSLIYDGWALKVAKMYIEGAEKDMLRIKNDELRKDLELKLQKVKETLKRESNCLELPPLDPSFKVMNVEFSQDFNISFVYSKNLTESRKREMIESFSSEIKKLKEKSVNNESFRTIVKNYELLVTRGINDIIENLVRSKEFNDFLKENRLSKSTLDDVRAYYLSIAGVSNSSKAQKGKIIIQNFSNYLKKNKKENFISDLDNMTYHVIAGALKKSIQVGDSIRVQEVLKELKSKGFTNTITMIQETVLADSKVLNLSKNLNVEFVKFYARRHGKSIELDAFQEIANKLSSGQLSELNKDIEDFKDCVTTNLLNKENKNNN